MSMTVDIHNPGATTAEDYTKPTPDCGHEFVVLSIHDEAVKIFIQRKEWPTFEDGMLNALEQIRRFVGTGKTPEADPATPEPLDALRGDPYPDYKDHHSEYE